MPGENQNSISAIDKERSLKTENAKTIQLSRFWAFAGGLGFLTVLSHGRKTADLIITPPQLQRNQRKIKPS
ncbi:hypothetical protein [Calothrix sp. 336/3]|uniref:hypothetical protein n=1 Tax=Calothrix sp. 336/3 TaxID=1337936 RepID=UPI0004E32897|nr:hypothetical protein [Calothrix sp. 336/3]AKG21541.1 hypothetical protein IJ00_09850 [Calothrix sp. 336/3]